MSARLARAAHPLPAASLILLGAIQAAAAGSAPTVAGNSGCLITPKGTLATAVDGVLEFFKTGDTGKTMLTDATTCTPASYATTEGVNAALSDMSSAMQDVKTDPTVVRYSTDQQNQLTNLISLNAGNAQPVLVRNVASGNITAGSTDAVNGSQLYDLQQNVSNNVVGYDKNASGQKGNSITLSGGDPAQGVTIKGVANGVAPTDAVNKSQLDQVANDAAVVRYTRDAQGQLTNLISLNAGNAQPVQVRNVAKGSVTAGSTDAVNGSQLYDLQQSVNTYGVSYDKTGSGQRGNSITLAGGDPGQQVVIRGVGNGVAATDAVNKGQLDTGLSSTLQQSKSYTDSAIEKAFGNGPNYDARLNEASSTARKARREAHQAGAMGLALSGLRYDATPGKVSVGAGSGVWKGSTAFAVGMGYTHDQNWRFNAGVSGAMNGDWGAAAGASFTLN